MSDKSVSKTSIKHNPSSCLGQKKCGKCKPSCPFQAIVFYGDIAMTIDEKKCNGPCYDQYKNQIRPCKQACHNAIADNGGGPAALIYWVE